MKRLIITFCSLLMASALQAQVVKPDAPPVSPPGPNTKVYYDMKMRNGFFIPHYSLTSPPSMQDTVGKFNLNTDDGHVHVKGIDMLDHKIAFITDATTGGGASTSDTTYYWKFAKLIGRDTVILFTDTTASAHNNFILGLNSDGFLFKLNANYDKTTNTIIWNGIVNNFNAGLMANLATHTATDYFVKIDSASSLFYQDKTHYYSAPDTVRTLATQNYARQNGAVSAIGKNTFIPITGDYQYFIGDTSYLNGFLITKVGGTIRSEISGEDTVAQKYTSVATGSDGQIVQTSNDQQNGIVKQFSISTKATNKGMHFYDSEGKGIDGSGAYWTYSMAHDSSYLQTKGVKLLIAAGAPPSGTAGNDLSGTYPNPTVAKFNGQFPSYYLNYANLTGKPTNVSSFANDANYISGNQTITLSGDISGSGSTAITASLPTVNSSPGTYGDASHTVTTVVNGKGLATSVSQNSIQIAESQVTNLASDLAAKQATISSSFTFPGSATFNNNHSVIFESGTSTLSGTSANVGPNGVTLTDNTNYSNYSISGGLFTNTASSPHLMGFTFNNYNNTTSTNNNLLTLSVQTNPSNAGTATFTGSETVVFLDSLQYGRAPVHPNDVTNKNYVDNALAGKVGAETDPTVPSYAKSLNSFAVIKSSTDALYQPLGSVPTNVSSFTNDANYITPSSTNTLTNKSGNISQWTNDIGYLNSIPTLQQVANAGNSFSGQIQSQTFGATGTGGNGYYDILSQSASPTSASGHLKIYSDSLNRLSWKNSTYRRTVQVPYPSDYTIRMPYLAAGTTLEDSTHAAVTYYKASNPNGYITNISGFNTSNLAEGGNLYFTNSRAITAALTGYASGAGTVSSSDNILQAIQKINGNEAADAANIATNTSNIAANTTNIATNTTAIAGKQNTITTNSVTSDLLANNGDEDFQFLKDWGSSIKGWEPGNKIYVASNNAQSLTSGVVYFMAMRVPVATTLTGIKVRVTTTGSYTGNNYNGVGLYTVNVSTGVATLVASSTNNSTLWTASTGFLSIPFSSTYSAAKGNYYVALMYSSSAQTTAPALTMQQPSNTVPGMDFSNNLKLQANFNGQTALPSTQTFSSVSGANTLPFTFLY